VLALDQETGGFFERCPIYGQGAWEIFLNEWVRNRLSSPVPERRSWKPDLKTRWNAVKNPALGLPLYSDRSWRRGMTHTMTVRRVFGEISRILEHFAVIVLGFVLMVVGLGLGVTMIMLPVGLVLGLVGIGLFVAGIFGHLDSR
jgi:hypothetical protein